MKFLHRIKNKIKRYNLILNGAKIGHNSIIYYSVDIQNASSIKIGENSILYKNISIYASKNGLFEIKDNSHIAPYCYFLVEDMQVIIGNDVAIGPYCSFFCVSNSSKGKNLFRQNYTKGSIEIGNNVFIGSHCVVLPGTRIQSDVVVAANSVVLGELLSGYIYSGSPAIAVKKIEQ
jgi:acetyltransferase-like isoleucine patch superfamily enzyme